MSQNCAGTCLIRCSKVGSNHFFLSFLGPFSFAWIKQQGEAGIFSFFSINADKSTQSGKYVKTYIFEI